MHAGNQEKEGQTSDYERQRQLDQVKSVVLRKPDAAFFGPVMCSLDFQWDESVVTAATNGEYLKWAPSDFDRCRAEDKGEGPSTLMHEFWHVVRLHALRCGNRCPDVWNTACDIWINRELKKAGYYVGTDWVLRPDLDHIEAEEDIYDALPKNPGGGNPPPPGSRHGKCQHAQSQFQGNPQASIAVVVKAVQAAKQNGQPGSIPGNTEEIIDRFLSPIIPWEQRLKKWMTDLRREEFSWARPTRRNMPTGMYLPSRYEDEGRLAHLVYFQDVSGSIGPDEILRFNSELKYVWDFMKPKRMTVIQFDTRIQKIDEFKQGDKFEEIKIVGRGGTCLICVREKIMELKPTAAIIFTDLQVAPMQKLPFKIPVLWVGVNAAGATVPFGELIHIKTCTHQRYALLPW